MPKSNSKSLANQLAIHLILAKHEKLDSNSLANQLGKNRNLAKTHRPHTDRGCHRHLSVSGRVKKRNK
jgi:hypothetical protein